MLIVAGMERLSRWRDVSSEVPLQRVGHINDIANTTLFLFSDAANWISGQAIAVDGAHENMRSAYMNYPADVIDSTEFFKERAKL